MTSEQDVTDALRPKLRAVEAVPMVHQGRRVVLLHDPTGLARGTVRLSPTAFFIVSHFDGQHSALDIQTAFIRQYGQLLFSQHIHQMVQKLDEAGFLDGAPFERYYAEQAEQYRCAAVRRLKPQHDVAQLQEQTDRILAEAARASDGARICGLIVPHLDYERGGSCYAAGYGALARRAAARRFMILGTNHFGRASGVVATDKPFETPFGIAEVDRRFLATLCHRCGPGLLDRQFDHQQEHSVELQVMLLQRLFGADLIRIVPVLCPDVCMPRQSEEKSGVAVREFAAILGDAVRQADEPVCVIAGADLSHVGPRFGDACRLEADFMVQVERRDRQFLQHVERNDPAAMLEHLRHEQNATRICSSGCLFAALSALPQAKVELLCYHQSVTPEIQTAVTCAALALTG